MKYAALLMTSCRVWSQLVAIIKLQLVLIDAWILMTNQELLVKSHWSLHINLGVVLINDVTVIQRVINHSPSRRSFRRILTFSIFPSKAPSSAESPEKILCQLKCSGQYISSIIYAVVNIHRRNVVRCASGQVVSLA